MIKEKRLSKHRWTSVFHMKTRRQSIVFTDKKIELTKSQQEKEIYLDLPRPSWEKSSVALIHLYTSLHLSSPSN
jgi:hypothetical protein